jgi:DNA-binding MarR family transcriptional regulator/N-acetylglutamate synthase-like GNAT family acetyltransferase
MATPEHRIAAVRAFSRFYTKRIGLLSDGILGSEYSLSEARVIYELAQRDVSTGAEVAQELDLDAGYVSRILRAFERLGLIAKERSQEDRRRILVRLSAAGRDAFEQLNSGSREQIAGLLGGLDDDTQDEIVASMRSIERALGAPEVRTPRVSYRPHAPGDMGWIVQRHGELYHESHGWDQRFEAMVAHIVGELVEKHDPSSERCWIAEVDGRRAGAIALVRRSKTLGQLRLLLVEPWARGHGIGARLVSECVGHARHVGYRKIVLFTVRGLEAARRLYEAEGFRLVDEETTQEWGQEQIQQKWELRL